MINNKNEIHSIAIGTYGLGAERFEIWKENKQNGNNDAHKQHIEAILYSYECGQNFIETSFIYAGGQTMNFLSDFFKQVQRDKIFITVKLENYIEKIEDIEMQLDKYLKIMNLEYADSFLLHTPKSSKLLLDETYYQMIKMVDKGKTRFLSASNLNFEQLKYLNNECGFKLFSFEGLYNLECKVNEDVGIIQYCNENDIAFICYQPLRRNRTANRNYKDLVNIANKHDKTQNQVLLNWISKHKKLIPIIKASKKEHIIENLEALNFELDRDDIEKLNAFRSTEFDSIQVDWEDNGGIPIYKFANQFE